MTALVYALQPDQVCIAMDTLVIGADDHLPFGFQRKFLSIPSREMLVAGTGHAGFITGWFDWLQQRTDAGGVDAVNTIAPAVLESSANAGLGLGATTATIYHFGFSESAGSYVGYAYRSTSHFQSERLPYALGFKPQVPVPSTDNIEFPEFMVGIVQRQQQHDRSLPIAQQVGIGGEIEFAVLSNHTTCVETVYRFKSYADEAHHIASRIRA